MTVPSQPRVRRRRRHKSHSALIAGLFVLAIAASVFLVASNSVEALRIGVVAALWAAFLGALAVTKYRKEAEADRAKMRDLRMVYEMQLSREVAARRRHELTVESKLRRELEAEVRDDTSQQLAAVQRELTSIRGALEHAFSKEIPVSAQSAPMAIAAASQRPQQSDNKREPSAAEPANETSGDDVVDVEFETEYESPAAQQRTVAEILDDLRAATGSER
ncbi:hypothetical protein ONR57_05555 [Hoyosella sp. YIM 151337]|uniref:DUF6779 domain-containing protein n=1 Tax=Hoyosella sp. YIM 151337 TaxID=2992742 RepID=UPI00223668EE|nr:DUF6779 domain-containing protein [Hoyosella sp. YIM 151337]MCW4352761.1 hypothetical protein [Hoyosella sp. YIM 151337]